MFMFMLSGRAYKPRMDKVKYNIKSGKGAKRDELRSRVVWVDVESGQVLEQFRQVLFESLFYLYFVFSHQRS